MDTKSQVYRDLQVHLDRLPIGFPPTESGVEIRILKHLFTPEEARLATQLSMIPEPLSRIHGRVKKTGMTMEELGQKLDRMVEKGSIMATEKGGKKEYSLVPLVFGMFEMQLERLTPDFARDTRLYFDGEFGKELYRTKIPQLRTIPVGKSIPMPDKFQVSTYDDARQLIQNVGGKIAVVNCVCRQARNIIGENCGENDIHETCLVFREVAEGCLQAGIGRAITGDGALAILEKAQAAGLVLQPENSQHPLYLCCCCGDCCGILTTVKKFPRPADLYATNYYSEVDAALCTGCETCVDRCQLEAITVVDGVAIVNLDRCIGCGNCVPICDFGAAHLRKKELELVPPEDSEALYKKILAKKVGKWNMLKVGAKVLLKRKV